MTCSAREGLKLFINVLQYPTGYQQAMGPPPQPIYPQQPQTVYAQGAFDSGARFDGVSQPRIPVSVVSV